MFLQSIFLAIFLWINLVFSNGLNSAITTTSTEYEQWFTGPILTPTPITMPVGHPGLEVAWLVGKTYGNYNSHWNIEHTPSIWSIPKKVEESAA